MAQPVYGTPWQTLNQPVSEEELADVDRYWRAANYLSVGQIYLRSNPLMRTVFLARMLSTAWLATGELLQV